MMLLPVLAWDHKLDCFSYSGEHFDCIGIKSELKVDQPVSAHGATTLNYLFLLQK